MKDLRGLAEILDSLQHTQRAFLDILNQTNDAILYQRPDEDMWTLAEVLVHMAEAREFFANEVLKVLAKPGVTMGRTIEHPGRIQNVAEHGNDAAELIRSKIEASYKHLQSTLGAMTDEDLQTEGEHVKYGLQTLAEFIEHFIVEHDEIHVQQARSLL
jgi:uncharacterized damage-inducible protein DinB